jgi:hypothetical protein
MLIAIAESVAATAGEEADQALARRLLASEAAALLGRLRRLEPLVFVESAVPAAMPPRCTLAAIDRHLAGALRPIRRGLRDFLRWLNDGHGREAPASEGQRRLGVLRMRALAGLADYDIFTDAITQRSERRNGVWLAGLDAVARDALALSGDYYRIPHLVCYLDRGRGAAIRRLRTRLPSGAANPVAVIRVPRERMLGSAVASSLLHEVGHQASALLELMPSVQPMLRAMQLGRADDRAAWQLFERWIGEILADLWSVGQVGIAATVGLIGVLSVPVPFVFRFSPADPHPCPWVRVLLSAALGNALHPDPQWQVVARSWRTLYPLGSAPTPAAAMLVRLEALLPTFAALLVSHRPPRLRGASLRQVLATREKTPAHLAASFEQIRSRPRELFRQRPARALAILGQARAHGRIDVRREGDLLDRLLNHWALAQTRADDGRHCGAPAA